LLLLRVPRDEVTGEWRRIRNEELNNLCRLPNVTVVIKSRRMGWARYVVRIGWKRFIQHGEELKFTGLICLRIATGGGLL
jgi:hypothetical protein